MKKYIVIIISLLIDLIITNTTLYEFNNITYFMPLCTVITLLFLDNKKIVLFLSIIYGALILNNILLGILLFFIIYNFSLSYNKIFKYTSIPVILEIVLTIGLYEFIYFILISFINNTFIFTNYLYKVLHTMLLNIIYGLILYKIFYKKSSKLNY